MMIVERECSKKVKPIPELFSQSSEACIASLAGILTQSEIDFLKNMNAPKPGKEKKSPAPIRSSKKSSGLNIASSLEKNQGPFKKRSPRSIKNSHLQSKTSFLKAEKKQEISIEEGLAFTDFSMENFQPTIHPRSEANFSEAEKKKETLAFTNFSIENLQPPIHPRSEASFLKAEKEQKIATKKPQVFLDYSKIVLQPNINPVLESPQISKHEYKPIFGYCADLIETTVTYATPPENADLTQYILSKTNEGIQEKHIAGFSEAYEDLMTDKETVMSPQTSMIQSEHLYSMQESEVSFFFDEKGLQKHRFFKANGRAQINLMSSEKTASENNCMTPSVDLDCERTPPTFFFQNTNLEEEKTLSPRSIQNSK